jgi:hypothetical protein
MCRCRLYSLSWFLTLFGNAYVPLSLRVLSYFFEHGWVVLYRTGVAIMQASAPKILGCHSVEALLTLLLDRAIFEDVDNIMLGYSELQLPEDLLADNQRAFEALPNKGSTVSSS